jgi:hypothetical protein
MEEGRSVLKKCLQVNLQEIDVQEGLDGVEKTILEWILKK